jgi:hypothetical protein
VKPWNVTSPPVLVGADVAVVEVVDPATVVEVAVVDTLVAVPHAARVKSAKASPIRFIAGAVWSIARPGLHRRLRP